MLAELSSGINNKSNQRFREAYEFALAAHHGLRRESGELYIEHDLAVAQIMAPLDVDTNTLITCILHDALLPHTGIDVTEIEQRFGAEVSNLVTSLSKLQEYAQKAEYSKKTSKDVDNPELEVIRQAILSIIEGDIRVILIRMADCLQDLRKASGLTKAQQKDIAAEAMYIYAPLANRLGVWHLKWELEDLAFRYLDPVNYKKIAKKLTDRRAERTKKIEEAAETLRAKIRETDLNAEVTGRSKHIYSIYRKMRRKRQSFEQISDIQALRVILFPKDPQEYAKKNPKEKADEERSLCYEALGLVHSLWQPIPGEFDDYIGTPKPNGYRSLHTAVLDLDTGLKLEVQIRSFQMHEEAEKGIAAHWAYKEGGARFSSSAQKRIQNLRDLLTTLQEADDDQIGRKMLATEGLSERIYAFTPNGDVVELPHGSTPIDFAYQIHTSVGHRCQGARINGNIVSLDYKLKSGDQIEIITSKRGNPRRDWMNASLGYTGSARTRSKIRQWFRKQERGKNIQQGREVVERELKRLGLIDTFTIEEIADALKFNDVKEFLSRVGFGDIQSSQISGALMLMQKKLKPDDEELLPLLLPERPKSKGLTILGTSGLPTKMAGCCSPIPPEPIVGYITRGHGVTIHRQDCKQLEAITDRERIINEVDWGQETATFPIPVIVHAYRRPHLVDEMAGILRGQQIVAPKTKTMTTDSELLVYLVVEVSSLEQLNWLLKKFEALPNVIEARRQRWS
ncbi:MAG: bifunctional (p)ppGpp synthetase/guanosine-3',5'-bis(diphosphate) 3'-pyrophosphohydrolase [Candidatus Promineifilaceae bacterium]|nr:bifunctional (p)ppGpp synthetase/guanosine-3',5'-bis(diphosphate) 3'-pyrophosphohydrolase [Candidatus Promineifilaceae bacterium]